jgi:DNA-binding MarR family transcriptional regulator
MKSSAKTKTSAGAVGAGLPLPTLLSQAVVAFTIEFDNEAEGQIRHRTTLHGLSKKGSSKSTDSLHAPWLVSSVMWSNCMRFVGEDGVRVGELEELARTKTNLDGMQRWSYITVAPDPANPRDKPPLSDWVIRATPVGRRAQEVWRPLFGMIEQRWQERFGKDAIDQLRKSLAAVVSQIDAELPGVLPDCLPILQYGLFSRTLDYRRRAKAAREHGEGDVVPAPQELTLSALISKALLAFAIAFECESDLSLAICANVLRVIDDSGVRIRDPPRLAGVSKVAIKMATGFLAKERYIVIEADPSAARTKLIRLTPKGRDAHGAYLQRLRAIEERWQERFGKENIRNLREALERLVGNGNAERSPLFLGLNPPPDGWRASVPKPETLPHFPIVLHRGGYPDGS